MAITNPILQLLVHVADAITEANKPVDTSLFVEADTTAELITKARALRGVTAEELVRRTGISTVRLSFLESGSTRIGGASFWEPDFDELVEIKKALDLSPDSLRKFL